MHALVVGGTGPTGHFIVNGLLSRGFEVSILQRWKKLTLGLADIDFKQEPGFGMAYSGPGGRARSQQQFKE